MIWHAEKLRRFQGDGGKKISQTITSEEQAVTAEAVTAAVAAMAASGAAGVKEAVTGAWGAMAVKEATTEEQEASRA